MLLGQMDLKEKRFLPRETKRPKSWIEKRTEKKNGRSTQATFPNDDSQVPFFSEMDDQLLDAICELLVSSLSIEGTYIVREDDPITEMLFIIRGRLESSTTNGGRPGFFNSITLKPRDFCRKELLAWALLPKLTQNLPSSTRTVRTLAEVKAFAFQVEDLKRLGSATRGGGWQEISLRWSHLLRMREQLVRLARRSSRMVRILLSQNRTWGSQYWLQGLLQILEAEFKRLNA
ncbi:putative cyclic nucleotide-gated ion channel 14 [Camellia lanceoleosa]|uniref:Cyclic nucleotide-gated ion channel 14 n=1 Tax=Camellia lanceoleosa TaxID=1840588 RepID=A0ACC0HL73_9ERIC|nr:putative cyclic nucleotide-gated ion channel 14 [Camellia lanceoleosa]